MSDEIWSTIAAKFQQGVTFERILDDIRDALSSEGLKRKHMVTRVDINNVQLLYNIEGQSNTQMTSAVFLPGLRK